MKASELHERLIHPRHRCALAGYGRNGEASIWTCMTIEARVEGLGILAGQAGLLNKIRGAIGDAMLAGASNAVKIRQPCTWSPCCAAEVFFAAKPLVETGLAGNQAQLPKPYVLSARRHGARDLLVVMTIFGLAKFWAQNAADALGDALQNRVHWQKLAAGEYFVPPVIHVPSLTVCEKPFFKNRPCPEQCVVSFITPLDAERSDLAQNPGRILEKLIMRAIMMARWYESALDVNHDEISQITDALTLEFQESTSVQLQRLDTASGPAPVYKRTLLADLEITGEISPLWPLLLGGETTHVGRGAVRGFGCYRLIV